MCSVFYFVLISVIMSSQGSDMRVYMVVANDLHCTTARMGVSQNQGP